MGETVEEKLAEAYKNITEAHMLRTVEAKLAETYQIITQSHMFKTVEEKLAEAYKIITEKHMLKLDALNFKLSFIPKVYGKVKAQDEDLACQKEQKGE